ncbi:TolC family protein [Noviherbaspirillum sp. CPCC 100848]|uniref:TolC family protein n=1 Tax=Noviherbaspirillum album TaxID=3080276 RepID=A0ABU6JDN4_9BURK|nr:TolC family protein [Noviherbaspirillum sp. CPCC 100848]MEC4721635.1 TolC family protein [Noviherbaspirillum sp. CPCC 100848]
MRAYILIHTIFAAAALFFLRLPVAHAGDFPDSLKAAVEAAWQRSPQARTLEAKRDEILAGHEAARSWIAGSPSIGVSERSDRWNNRAGSREREISLSAPVWMPGQVSARRMQADAEAAELEARIASLRLTLAGEVRERIWAVAAAKESLAEATLRQNTIEATAGDVMRRVKAGDLARTDGMLAQQEALAAKAGVVDTQLKLREALLRFTTLTGITDIPPMEPEPLAAVAVESHPRLYASKAAVRNAQALLDVASKTRSEPPTVGVALRREREAFGGETASSVTLGIEIPIGTVARSRPLETAARTRLATASAEASQSEAMLQADIALAREQMSASEQALDVSASRVALAREHAQLIEKAFRMGERGLADMLRAQSLLHEAEAAERQQRVALGLARARLNQAFGVSP